MSLGKKSLAGASLLLLRKIWGNIVNLGVMAFLARVLSKEDFGLLAISSVFLSIINTMAASGISEYVVYYDGEDRALVVNAAFWLNFLLTIAVVVIVLAMGPLWADFYGSEKVYYLLLLLLMAFFFEMGSTIPKTILRKELEYKFIVLYSSIAMTAISFGKMGAAWAGLGVYSLALPQVFVSPFLMIAFFFKTRWRPALDLGIKYYRQIFQYTKHIVGGRVLTKLVNEGDNLIVGKLIGLEGLGIYSLAFQLANLVTSNIVFLVSDIFLPVLSKVKYDVSRLKMAYYKMTRFLALVTFPLIIALVLASEGIISVIYGDKWIDAVIPFQILCLFALSRSINSPTSSLFNARGRPDLNFRFALLFTPIFLLSVYLGSLFGVIGVALATTICRFGGAIVMTGLALKLIDSGWSDLLAELKGISISSIITFLIFSFLLVDFANSQTNWVRIASVPLILYFNFVFFRIFYFKELNSLIDYISRTIGFSRLVGLVKILLFIRDEKENI